jgi:hypothetical protein
LYAHSETDDNEECRQKTEPPSHAIPHSRFVFG